MVLRRAGIVALVLAVLATAGPPAHAAGPTLTAPPSVTGTAAAGNRLSAGIGTWTSGGTIAYGYQWYRCDGSGAHCSRVQGATAAGYELGAKDVGKSIGLTVVATDSTGTSTAYASLVGPVAATTPLLVSTAQPQITGVPIAGKPLQVTTGAWSPMPTSVTYAWQSCNANGRICAPIAGATSSSYLVAPDDMGHALVALVQATFGTTTQAALSTATAPAIGNDLTGPTHSANPSVSGIAEAGSQFTGSAGIWTGIGSVTYVYQWYRCDDSGAHCSSIHGATKSTYRSVAKDVGNTLAFAVRATDTTGTAAAYASLIGPIAAAKAPLTSSVQPALAGSAHPGSALSAGAGAWLPAAGALAYQWTRCNANGRICVPISGATLGTYKVTPDDVGHSLVAVVTSTNGATTQAAYSTASPPVA